MITQEICINLFDYKNGNLYWKIKKSNRIPEDKKAGYIRKDNYCCLMINKKLYLLHRLIFLYHNGYMPKYIDHIDCNKSNNKIENLRETTLSQNQHNRKLSKNNTSGVKGVSWNKKNKKWLVSLMCNNVQKYFGYYDNIELAELVAIEAKNKYHKNFARHV